MTNQTDQRRLLGAFLRARREACDPARSGLGVGTLGRRRTPGLRREEVAQLCGVSTTWYTWAEQGRDVSLSALALSRIAEALQLSPAERRYLFELARRRDPAPLAERTPAIVPADLSAVMTALAAPAYLMDRLWRACAWNPAAARLFAPWFDSGEACLLRYVFIDPTARAFICDWEHRARRILAEFRSDTAQDPDAPEVLDLIAGLRRDSQIFERLWAAHAVLPREGGERSFNHPTLGLIHYSQTTLVPAAQPSFKLVVLTPSSEAGSG